MADKRPDDMPQTPRDYDDPSYSEIVPIKSTSIKILKSPLFYVIAFTGVLSMLMFTNLFSFSATKSVSSLVTYGTIAIGYLLLIVLALVYLYSRSDKPFFAFFIPSLVLFVLLMSPIGQPFFFVFRSVLPGDWASNTNIITHFIGMFFGAGLMEELMKSIPGLFGAWLALKGSYLRKKAPKLYDWMAVRGPLDGLLLGVFAGAMFIFIETGTQYFPNSFIKNPTADKGLAGLMLLLPRVTSGMVGHMCWAGITGYFIGLTVQRPNAWKYALYAWIGASFTHAVWNTGSHIPLLWPVAIAGGGIIFIACFLKAKQMDQSLGRQRQDYGSIVVKQSDRPAAPPTPAGKSTAAASTAPKEPTVIVTSLFLQTGKTRLKVVPGVGLDFSQLAENGMNISGLVAAVTSHPTRKDVLGLKNLGEGIWNVTLRDGSHIKLKSGRNIRLAAGVKIDFGNDVILDVYEGGA